MCKRERYGVCKREREMVCVRERGCVWIFEKKSVNYKWRQRISFQRERALTALERLSQ